jgi:hypothetical protein
MLVLVGILGVGMAALRDGSEFSERICFTLMLAALIVAVVGAIVRRRYAAWAGFAVCGSCYAILAFVPAINREVAPHLLTTAWLDGLVARLHPRAGPPPSPPKLNSQFMSMLGDAGHLRWWKDLPNRFLLSPAEEKALERYDNDMNNYQLSQLSMVFRTENAKRIGQTLLTMTIALMGANLGRFLARWRTAAESSLSTGPDHFVQTSPLSSSPERAEL